MNPGGIAAYSLMVARHLRKKGCPIAIASGGGRWVELAEREGIPHHRVALDTSSEVNPKLLGAIFSVRRLVREDGFSILHDQTRVTQVVAVAVACATGVRRVSTCHGFHRTRLFRRFFPFWGERVIAVSGAVGEHLKSDWKLDDLRIRVVPHGFEPVLAGGVSREERRRKIGAAPDDIVVVAVGRLSPVKGFDTLVRAVEHLKGKRVRVWIAGEGPEQARLERLVAECGVSDAVTLMGLFDDPSALLAAADIFCAPSIQEGFGLSALEAMGAGLPVVASRVGALPSFVIEDRTGLLVDPADPKALAAALEGLASDPGHRARLGASAAEYVRAHYPIEAMMRKTLEVYEELSA